MCIRDRSKTPENYIPGQFPLFIEKSKGAYLWDIDGNRYTDYIMGYGAISLGYCIDEVDEAAIAQKMCIRDRSTPLVTSGWKQPGMCSRSTREPAAPVFGSAAPPTTRGICAFKMAPAHIGHGSSVTYSAHCQSRQPPRVLHASAMEMCIRDSPCSRYSTYSGN